MDLLRERLILQPQPLFNSHIQEKPASFEQNRGMFEQTQQCGDWAIMIRVA